MQRIAGALGSAAAASAVLRPRRERQLPPPPPAPASPPGSGPAADVAAAAAPARRLLRPALACQPLVLCETDAPAFGAQNQAVGWRSERRKHHRSERLIRHTDFIYTCICQGRLQDSYSLERELGWGSFGTVYLARHKHLGYARAVKRLQKNPDDPQHVNLIMNEVHALMDLDHPNIVKLVRYYDDGKHLYLVFELCTGPDLFTRICDAMKSDAGRMTEADAAMVLCQMLKALKCCHHNYMGHFDVKPENFMYSNQELTTLKMIDLGLSSGFKRDAREIRGTAEYMAPEIWDGLYGPEADIWSCGVVLFVMLTGCSFLPPKESEDELRRKVRDRKWIRQRLRWAARQGISQNAQNMLSAMLRHDRHQRPTVREALWHPFVASCHIENEHSNDTVSKAGAVLKALPTECMAFAAEPVLKRAVLLLAAHIGGYGIKDAQPQRLAFAIIDRNCDGELSIEALELHYLSTCGKIPDTLEAAISGVDVNDDGYITYLEFLSATLPESMRRNEGLFRVVFELIDRSRDGFIDAADLAAAFRHGRDSDNVCKAALAEVCQDPDGLSWEAFRRLMLDETSRRRMLSKKTGC